MGNITTINRSRKHNKRELRNWLNPFDIVYFGKVRGGKEFAPYLKYS